PIWMTWCLQNRDAPDKPALEHREGLPRLPVVRAVWPHVGGGGHTIRHVEKAGDRRNVPDVAVGEADAPQPLAVAFLDAPGRSGELDREVEHGTLAFGKPRDAIIHDEVFAEQRIAGILPNRRAMSAEAVVAAILR